MSGRISIPAQDKRGAHRDPNEFMQVPRGEWLALVEAVEATNAYALTREGEERDVAYLRMCHALDRFDFGEQT